MKKGSFILFMLLIGVTISRAQYVSSYRSPVDFPMILAGNVGEVRSNHFHTGIDIKASRGIGSPIYAIADGYVSRIGVAPNGYGNFVSVTHKDGMTSLYAHLHDFSPELKQYINGKQLAAKKYAIDLYLKADQLPIKSGEPIGLLGNSGSSSGPHLHFEIRDGNANAVNIIRRSIYEVPDKFPPIVSKVFVYQCDTIEAAPIFKLTQTINFEKDKYGRYSKPNESIKISKKAYIAYQIVDYKDARTNTMGISQLEQKIDGKVNFDCIIDKISYATIRFINTFVQYDLNRASNFSVIRAYVSPNNKLDIYKNIVNRGLIDPPSKGSQKRLSTTIVDDAGNDIQIEFDIVRGEESENAKLTENEVIAHWNVDQTFKAGNLTVNIPFGSLYEDCVLPFRVDSGVYIVGNEGIALQKKIVVNVAEFVPEYNQEYACLAVLKNNGKLSYIGGGYVNGEIVTKTNTLGKFVIAYDSIAPVIKPRIRDKATLKGRNIVFTVTDDLSGVASYDIYIDDKWVIGEFDPKTSSLKTSVALSNNPNLHRVLVCVKDRLGNVGIFKTSYLW